MEKRGRSKSGRKDRSSTCSDRGLKRIIRRFAFKNRPISARSLAEQYNAGRINKTIEKRSEEISETTVRRVLAQGGIKKAKPKKILSLSAKHLNDRLTWCKEYQNLDWKRVIFSDESVFQLEPNILKLWGSKKSPELLKSTKFLSKQMV